MTGDEGGRTLGGGASEPLPPEWANRTGSAGARTGRVGGISSGAPPTGNPFGGGRPPRPQDDDDDDDDEDSKEGESWFAGGERSGISVENPGRANRDAASGRSTVRDILKKAAQGGRPPEPPAQTRSPLFTGGGHTLGSDEQESTYIADPDALSKDDDEQETAVREITFWRNGFSIQDGPLMSYEDPGHAAILDSINSGNAPPSVLNVQVGQPVELRVARRTNEDYVQPPKRFAAFEGSGNRLGSPLPATLTTSSSTSSQPPGAFPAASGGDPSNNERAASINTKFEVDLNQATTSVQIRLADGTRLVSRMNLTHTVGDIRGFIDASRPGAAAVPYTIGTTFPNRILDDNTLTIQAAGLTNSVVVQRLI